MKVVRVILSPAIQIMTKNLDIKRVKMYSLEYNNL
jgi:hypothetical protein